MRKVLLAGLILACAGAGFLGEVRGEKTAPVASASAPAVDALTQTYAAVGKAWETKLMTGNDFDISHMVDEAAFGELATNGVDMNTWDRSGLGERIRIGQKLAGDLMRLRGFGERMKYHTALRAAGGVWLVYRCSGPDVGYILLRTSGAEADTAKVTDADVSALGMSMSAICREIVKSVVPSAGGDGRTGLYARNEYELSQIRKMALTGKGAEALVRFKRLPEPLKKLEHVRIVENQCLSSAKDAEGLATSTDAMLKDYPALTSKYFMLATKYRLLKQWDKELEAVDAIEKQFGPDPLLARLRWYPLAMQGKFEEARNLLFAALKEEPRESEILVDLAQVSAEQEDFAEAIKFLKTYEKATAQNWRKLMEPKMVEKLTHSEAYVAWRGDGVDI